MSAQNRRRKSAWWTAWLSLKKLIEGAIAILRQAINGDLDWKAKRQPKLEPLKLSKIEATMSFTIAKGMVMQTAGKHYPAPITAVKTIEAAARLGRDDALKLENQSFVPLAHTNEARALVGIFLNDQFVKGKAKQLTKNVETPKHAAVLGAGIMGGRHRLSVCLERRAGGDEGH